MPPERARSKRSRRAQAADEAGARPVPALVFRPLPADRQSRRDALALVVTRQLLLPARAGSDRACSGSDCFKSSGSWFAAALSWPEGRS